MNEMRRLSYQNEEQQIINHNNNNTNNNLQFNAKNANDSTGFSFNESFFSSRVYKFKNLPQPRNATKGEILDIIMYSKFILRN